MIYKPSNVYPHNTAIDASKDNNFSFVFSGDSMTYADYRFYDVSNNKLVRHSYVPLKSSEVYNNKKFAVRIAANTFKNGSKYKYKMNLYQQTANIFVMQGTVRSIPEESLTDTQIPITYGITEIESPIKYTINGTETTFGSCYIEIDDGTNKERRQIVNYNPELKYGTDDGYGNYDYRTYVTISAPFSVKPTEGTTYKIFKNYITTPEYYFECYKTPVILPKAELKEFANILCTSDYFQEQKISVKNYQYSLYKTVEDSIILETSVVENENNSSYTIYVSNAVPEGGLNSYNGKYVTISYTDTENNYTVSQTRIVESVDFSENCFTVTEPFDFTPMDGMSVKVFRGSMILVSESPVIYNRMLKYTFTDVIRDVKYKLKLKVTTQANTVVENEISGIFQSVNTTEDNNHELSYYVDNENNSVVISYKDGGVLEVEDITNHETRRIVFGNAVKRDYLVASNHNYKYNLYDTKIVDGVITYGSKYSTSIISPVWNNWMIYGLVPEASQGTDEYNLSVIGREEPNKKCFRMEESWSLCVSAEESEIVQNLNRYTHTGYYSKPKVTVNDNNYITGSFNCSITQMNPVDSTLVDSIYKTQEWRKFISGYEMYVLKNPKGDVWAISITDNPTSQYEYGNKLMQTKISFAFTECMDIKDISIVN